MRLVRYGELGFERTWVIAADESLRSMSLIIKDLEHEHLTPSWSSVLMTIDKAAY